MHPSTISECTLMITFPYSFLLQILIFPDILGPSVMLISSEIILVLIGLAFQGSQPQHYPAILTFRHRVFSMVKLPTSPGHICSHVSSTYPSKTTFYGKFCYFKSGLPRVKIYIYINFLSKQKKIYIYINFLLKQKKFIYI